MSKKLLKQHAEKALQAREEQQRVPSPVHEQKTPTSLALDGQIIKLFSKENASLREQVTYLRNELQQQSSLNVVPPVPPYNEDDAEAALIGEAE